MPASYTNRQPSYSRRYPTCWASSQRSYIFSIHRAMESGYLLHSALTCPPGAIVLAAQFISSSDNIRVVHWADHQWKGEWLVNLTRLRTFIPDTGTHPPGMTSQEQPGSELTASAPLSDVSAPACINGVWPPLRPVSVAQKNKPSTMLSSNVQPIDLLMDCTAWRFWTMKQSSCSTPAPRSSATKHWIERTGSNDDEDIFQKSSNEVVDTKTRKWIDENNLMRWLQGATV